MMRTRSLLAVPLLAFLAGCSALLPTPAVETFDLATGEAPTVRQGRTTQVLVPEPVADRAYDTDRIVVRPSASEIAYFAGAQWSDRLPRLVQSRLIAALEASGRFRAAGRPGQGLAIDRQLVIEIRAFDYRSTASQVEIALSVKLMDDRTGRVIATESFRAEEPSADDAKSIAAALGRAQARTFTDIAVWAAKRG